MPRYLSTRIFVPVPITGAVSAFGSYIVPAGKNLVYYGYNQDTTNPQLVGAAMIPPKGQAGPMYAGPGTTLTGTSASATTPFSGVLYDLNDPAFPG